MKLDRETFITRKQELLRWVEWFVAEQRESKAGGWAEITAEDVSDLSRIVSELIELKCEPDADGDLPIEVVIVNRRTHEGLRYPLIPHDADDECTERTRLDLAVMHVGMAADRLRICWELARRRKLAGHS